MGKEEGGRGEIDYSRRGDDTALALCNHSLAFRYVDVSMRRYRVKYMS
jgi:hypothetical protein